jgi:DNA-binding NarL/FixJ family response regulator
VADRNPIDRRGLALLVATQDDLELVGEAASGHEAVACCRASRPNVLVLDTQLLEEDGVPTIAAVQEASPGTGVLVVASRAEDHCVILNPRRGEVCPRGERAVTTRSTTSAGSAGSPISPVRIEGTDCVVMGVLSGARSAIRRSDEPETLFRAVREVAAGNAWLDASTAARLAERQATTPPLTGRELDVAALVAEGRSNKEIGGALGISEATVKRHVGHLLAKLGVLDRLQLGLRLARNPQLTARASRRTGT